MLFFRKKNDADNNKIISLSRERDEARELLERILALDLSQCDLAVCLASAQDGSDVPLFRRVHLSQQAADEFRQAIDTALEPHEKALIEGNLVLAEFSADNVLEDGVIEYLRIPDHQTLAPQIADLHNFRSLERFDADEKAFTQNLRFYAIVLSPPASVGLQHPVHYYRWYSRTLLLSESSQHAICLHRQTGMYKTIDDPVLLFDRHVDCFSCGERMYILQKFYFYTIFRFLDALRDNARCALDILEAMDLIHSFPAFKQDCLKNKNKLLILSRIYHKPYLRDLSIADLEQIINDYNLPIDVEIINGKRKLKYNPRSPWAILHLLDDSYADSPLTQTSYHVKGKREIQKRR
ncbi:MAG: DUF4868 domain-containing protein [Ktedonobacteraceae bacterium]|nr:DUF4868 domain-containing protein [Ktedonobacteraceae bacterium]